MLLLLSSLRLRTALSSWLGVPATLPAPLPLACSSGLCSLVVDAPPMVVLIRLYMRNVAGLSFFCGVCVSAEPVVALVLFGVGVEQDCGCDCCWAGPLEPSGSFCSSSIKYTVRREPAVPNVKLLPVTSGASKLLQIDFR